MKKANEIIKPEARQNVSKTQVSARVLENGHSNEFKAQAF